MFGENLHLPTDATLKRRMLMVVLWWQRVVVHRSDFVSATDATVNPKVSMAALLYRGRELGRVGDPSYRRLIVKMSSMGWRKQEPMPLTSSEKPVLLTKAAQALNDEPKLLTTAINRVSLPDDFVTGLLFDKARKRSVNLSGSNS